MCTRVPRAAVALIATHQVATDAVVADTDILRALVPVLLAVFAFVAARTVTLVAAHLVCARAAVLARTRRALVNLLGAGGTRVAQRTPTLVSVHKVDTHLVFRALHTYTVVYVDLAPVALIALDALTLVFVAGAALLGRFDALGPVETGAGGASIVWRFAAHAHVSEE